MKWTPDDHGCIYDETGCFARLTPNKAERLASRHNADIDALAAEVDELRGKLDDVRMGIGCARGQRTTQYCAEAAQRDEVITKLLDLYKPGSAPEQHYKTWDNYQREYREWEVDCELYRLACEAAKKDPEQ